MDEGSSVLEVGDYDQAIEFITGPGGRVLGGTSFLWAKADCAPSVDVLFVDEAGQMSLANAVAVSQAASSVVLLGDPR